MMLQKLSFDEARGRFAKFGECQHDPRHFKDVLIPNSNTNLTNCGVCGKEIERFYGSRGLQIRLLMFLTESRTRAEIYFRFSDYDTNTIRGRLADLKREGKIFSIEKDVFTPVEKKDG